MKARSRPLLELISASLSGSDGNHLGTAALISPTIAITAANLVENHQEYFLNSKLIAKGLPPSSPPIPLSASVIARDDEIGFAVLELDPTLTINLPSTLLSAAEPETGTSWETISFPSPKPRRLAGDIIEPLVRAAESSEPKTRLRLRLLGTFAMPELVGSVGAPIVSNNQLVGLMAHTDNSLVGYLISLTEIMQSPAWKVVEKAMQSAAAAAIDHEQPLSQFRVATGVGSVRQGPDITTKIITLLGVNSVVERLEESADKRWFRVRTDKDGKAIEGWVIATLLEPVDGITTAPLAIAATFDRVAFVKRLTHSASSALAHATGMRVAQRQSEIHMEHLIAGLSQKEDGPTRTELRRAGIGQDQLAALVKEAVGTTLPDSYTPLLITDELSPLSKHVEQALSAAAGLADETGSKSIRSRDLLRGAFSVTECTLIQALIKRGVDPEKLRLEPGPATSRRPTQAGIKSDDPDGQDLLDIKNEVEALCTVLASRDVNPPISLGLFGDWGSGKSFFMKKMEVRFNELQDVARKEDSAYCSNIVQLWFNAWHYMDTNLWASLAKEIFDKLAQALATQEALNTGTADPEYLRAQLVAQKASANEAVAKAEQDKRDADAKVRASEQQLAGIQSGEASVAMSPQAMLREGYRFAKQQPEVRKTVLAADKMIDAKVEEAAKTLNIDRDPTAVREQLLELRGLWGPARAIWLAARNTRNKWLWSLSVVFLLIVVGVVWLLPQVLAAEWIQSAWLRLTGVGLALLAAVSPFLPAARRALQIMQSAIKSSQEAIEKARLEAEKKLQREHQEFQEAATKAQSAVEQAVTTAKNLTDQLDNLRADRQISNFIKQRQQSSDYAKHLGVIAKARNDFEQLSMLLAKEHERSDKEQEEQRRKKQQAPEGKIDGQEGSIEDQQWLLPRIDRIILYIDDLDRCPEDKVVDVLQAVHLLLAFPLFVVVVGVDPRWLLHSLRQHSKAFQDEVEDGDASEEERTHWRSTPLNYLEKIFQIPFTLRPMGESGFGKMIETLTKRPEEPKANEEPDKSNATGTETAERPLAEPESAAAKTAAPPPASTNVPEEPPLKEVAQESWTAKFLGFLKRTFRNSKDGDAASAGADSPQGAAGPPVAEVSASAAPEPPPDAAPADSPKSAQAQTSGRQAADQPAAEPIDPRPDHLLINPWEQEFMKQLHELIPSPRATKRFINIYRLIRASVDLDDKLRLEDFNGKDGPGQYRPVLLLLAILTGYPDQATEILRELLENEHKETWWEFIDSFKGRAERGFASTNGKEAAPADLEMLPAKTAASDQSSAGAWELKQNAENDNASLSDKVSGALSDADAESWKQLLEKLHNLRHLFPPEQLCTDFVEWTPKVARYSFQSGRVLITRSVRSSELGKQSVMMQVPKNDKPARRKKTGAD